MKEFPIATEKERTYEIEGQGGLWVREKYTDAKGNPESVRAMKGNSLAWFVPAPNRDEQKEKDMPCENKHKCNDYYVVGEVACKCCNGDYQGKNEIAKEASNDGILPEV